MRKVLFPRRLLVMLLTVVGACGISVMMASPAQAGGGVQYLVPDPSMWCSDWAESQLGNATGVEYHFVGLAGNAAKNTLSCRIVVAAGIQEGEHGSRKGWSGTVPYPPLSVNFADACHKQYGSEVGLKWIDAGSVWLTADRADDWIVQTGWYCVGRAGRYYDQSSRLHY